MVGYNTRSAVIRDSQDGSYSNIFVLILFAKIKDGLGKRIDEGERKVGDCGVTVAATTLGTRQL